MPWCSSGRYLDARPVFTLDPAFHAGAYYVQEASSMFLHHILKEIGADRDGVRVLDLCAAPGGKSTLIASVLDSSSLLISNEVIRSRATILAENAVRWGYMNHWVVSNDPRDFASLPGYFDVMVIDAPCSGSGLFRKDQAALDSWTEENVVLCAQRQQRILADAWDALKEDGVLIYATCSYSRAEDEEILDWLDASFSITPVTIPVSPDWGIVEVESAKRLKGYRFFPDKVDGEGFFIAVLRKKEAVSPFKAPRFKSLHDKKAWEQSSFLLNRERIACLPGKQGFHAIDERHEVDWHMIQGKLYLRKTGTELGVPVRNDWIPAHDTAVSTDRSPLLRQLELSTEQALRFLKKEDFSLPDAGKGWQLMTWQGLGLGWIKALGSRFNNNLPASWRIRMKLPRD